MERPLLNRLKYSALRGSVKNTEARKKVAEVFVVEPAARFYSGTGVTFLSIVTPVYSSCQYIQP
jgi:hypothetical protein